MRKVIGCRPVGAQILVRHLSAKEAYSTTLEISGIVKADVPQAIILEIGPAALLDAEKCGFKIGDRVILNGKGTMVPSWNDEQFGLVDPHVIKGVLIEEGEE